VFAWISRTTRPQVLGPPSPLLTFVAGDFAARIAGFWPEPHAAFLTAPAARRHLVCLALTLAEGDAAPPADDLLNRSFGRAIKLAAPDAPAGLARALERLGERAWVADDYRGLLRLLTEHRAAKLLRHADTISADEVQALCQLPQLLLEGGLGRLQLNAYAAGLVAEALEGIRRRDGEAAAQAVAARWAAADGVPSLARIVRDDLDPPMPPPPHPGTERLRPLVTKAALNDAAVRYQNCLRHHVRSAIGGHSAYYEWVEPPGAVVHIMRDRLHGWALCEARLSENMPIAEPMRAAIIADLRSMNVHVGRNDWELEEAIDNLANNPSSRAPDAEAAAAQCFGD
jgi:hypothetical protein